jgi:hypothetical protein
LDFSDISGPLPGESASIAYWHISRKAHSARQIAALADDKSEFVRNGARMISPGAIRATIAGRLRPADFGRQTLAERRFEDSTMSNGPSLSLAEIEERIAIARDNIQELIEQAAAYSGGEDEERNAGRLGQQQAVLDDLLQKRDALLNQKK